MQQHPIKIAENYTVPFLVTAFVLLFSSLFMIWAVFGLIPALVFSAGLNIIIPAKSSYS